MAGKRARKSAVELSPNRSKIDKMLKKGETPRAISEYLKKLEKKPENISHTAINNYRKNKFNIHKEASIKYHEKKSKKELDKASDDVVSDLEFLDQVKDVASKVKVKVNKDTSSLDIVKVGIQAVRTKNEILKAGEGDDKDITINIVSVDPDEDSNVEAGKETSR